jgi:uncharacterized protein
MTAHYGLARNIHLDALRGFAVMGILAMNIIGFAMPESAYISPAAYGGDAWVDRLSWLFSFIFVDGKMRGLFSLLFGASMMLIVDRAEAKQQSAAKVHYARMFWLAIFGLAHFFLLWFGDILFLYAVIGSLAFLVHHWQAKRLIKWALIIYGIGCLFFMSQFGALQFLQWAAAQPGADPDTVRSFADMMASGDFTMDIAKELAIHRGSWAGIVGEKFGQWFMPLAQIPLSITETLPLMLLGMAMKKNGFLTGDWAVSDYRRWIRRLLLPGLILYALCAAWAWAAGFDFITCLAVFLGWSMLPRLMLTIAYAGLLILLIRALSGSFLLGRVAATGRAAFTNYLGTSMVMTTIFYGYGFGLFGYVSRPILWLIVIAAWAAMLSWSKPWLDRFHFGPLEWLWRSLARMQWQPMR